jgi:hypothetical protein
LEPSFADADLGLGDSMNEQPRGDTTWLQEHCGEVL